MDEYVKRQLSSVPGHIGFYYKNLVTGETDGSRQTELFQAASVIKLPILAAILLEEREHPGVLCRSGSWSGTATKCPDAAHCSISPVRRRMT